MILNMEMPGKAKRGRPERFSEGGHVQGWCYERGYKG